MRRLMVLSKILQGANLDDGAGTNKAAAFEAKGMVVDDVPQTPCDRSTHCTYSMGIGKRERRRLPEGSILTSVQAIVTILRMSKEVELVNSDLYSYVLIKNIANSHGSPQKGGSSNSSSLGPKFVKSGLQFTECRMHRIKHVRGALMTGVNFVGFIYFTVDCPRLLIDRNCQIFLTMFDNA